MENEPNSDLSEKWHEIFYLIDKSGGVKLPNFKELTFFERFKVTINWWALFFGPIYYLIKRMWKKAFTYFFLIILAFVLVDYIAITFFNNDDFNIPGVSVSIMWAMLANRDCNPPINNRS